MPIITNPYILKSTTTPPASSYWSQTDKSPNVTVSSDGKVAYKTTGNGHALVRAVQGRSTGKFYVEFFSPVARGTGAGSGDGITAGLVTGSQILSSSPGEQSNGYGIQYRRYQSAGDGIWTYLNGSSQGTSGVDPAASAGWCGIAIDLDAQRLWWIGDGVWAGGKSPKSHPTSPYISFGGIGALFPAQSCYYGHDVYPTLEGALHVNAEEMMIGVEAFQAGGVLEGFLAWDGQDIPLPPGAEYDVDYALRKLLLKFDGGDNSGTLVDSSATPHTLTNNGSILQKSAVKKWGASSGQFGDGKYLAIPDSEDWNVGSGDFGIEGWFYFTDDPGSYAGDPGMYLVGQGLAEASSRSFGLCVLGNSLSSCDVMFEIITATTRYQCRANSVNITKNAWHYIAATRDGNTLRLGLDGAEIATRDVTGVTANNSPRPLLVGAFEDDTYRYYMRGYMDDVRFTKGKKLTVTAVPTAPFAVSAPAYGDALWDNVQALLHFNGANNSTVFYDQVAGNTWTVNGGAKISTAQSLFGGASGDFSANDGSKYIQLADRPGLRPGTGPYSIEYDWLNQGSPGQWATVFQKGEWNSAGGLTVIANGTNLKVCANGTDSGDIAHGMSEGNHYRIQISRDASNVCRVFVNGVQKGSFSQPQNINGTSPIQLMKGGGIVDPARGYLDEFRYTVGAFRNDAAYTPATSEFPNAKRLLDLASLHLHMNETDLSTDSSTRTKFGSATSSGIARVSGGFGGYEASFSGGAISYPADPDFSLPGAFTISAMVKVLSFANDYQGIFNIGQFDTGLLFRLRSGQIELFLNGTAYVWNHGNTLSTRTHVEVSRDSSGNLYAFINGTRLAGDAQDRTVVAANIAVLGRSAHYTAESLNGTLDEFRLLRGVCLHTDTFTPPAGPYEDDPGSNMPAKSLWAIDITANNGAAYTALQEVELRTAIGGPDVTTPATPTSSTNSYPGAGSVMLVDNDTTSLANAWVSASENMLPQRLTFRFYSTQDLKEIALLPQAYTGGLTRAPKDFAIKYYDKTAGWVTVKTFTGITDWAVDVWKNFALYDETFFDALMHFDGGDGGPLREEAGSAVTVQGSPALTTSYSKFGTASLSFPSAGSGVKVATPIVAAGGDFTAFAFVRLPALSSTGRTVFTLGVNKVDVYFTSATNLRAWLSDQGDIINATVPSVHDNAFHFVCIERKANTFYLSLDGVMVGTYTGAYADVAIPANTMLGAYNTSASDSLEGQLDEFGFIAGTALFNGTAPAVPTAAFPNSVRNRWNQTDKDVGASISADGMEVTRSESGNRWSWVRGTSRKDTGKWYLEMQATALGGGADVMMGMFPASAPDAGYPGQSGIGVGYYALNGTTYPNMLPGAGTPLATTDTVGIAYDADAGKMWFSVNNVWIRSGDPATGANPSYTVPSGLFAAAAMYTGPNTQKVLLKPNAATQAYAPPAGFQRWS